MPLGKGCDRRKPGWQGGCKCKQNLSCNMIQYVLALCMNEQHTQVPMPTRELVYYIYLTFAKFPLGRINVGLKLLHKAVDWNPSPDN